MKKILVIGSPGSGKSTLSRKLSEAFNLPCIYLDRLFWKPNWVETPKEEFDVLLQNELNKDCWIIDGNYSRTLPLRLKYADTVIWLNYPRIVCVWRVFWRHGKTRPDMTEECIEKRDKEFFEFLKYIWDFPKNNKKEIQELLSKTNAKIIIIHNNKELKDFINKISAVGEPG